MSDKISPIKVVKEAVSISWSRKWTFLGLVLICILPVVLVMGLSVLVPSWSGPLFFLTFAVHLLFMLFLMTTANHLAVTLQRGQGAVFPERFWTTLGRVLVRGLILMLVFFGAMAVFMVPAGVGMYFLLPQDGGALSTPWLLLCLVMVVGYFLVLGVFLRLIVMIPGAAVGHVVRVREAFAMTRGHAWRMFWAMVVAIVPVLVLVVLVQLFFFATAGNGDVGPVQVVVFIGMVAVDLFAWIVMLVINAVWYEKLRLRYEGGAPEAVDAPGVGPYAEVPTE